MLGCQVLSCEAHVCSDSLTAQAMTRHMLYRQQTMSWSQMAIET